MAKILDGKKYAEEIKSSIRNRLKEENKSPSLATVLVGDDPASSKYVELKERDCEEVGIEFKTYKFSSDVKKKELVDLIRDLNAAEDLDGILVQIPIPPHLDQFEVLREIEPSKDVDGLNPYNIGKLWFGSYDFEKDLIPCTPKGIVKLMDEYGIEIAGKRTTIVNRSNLVGKPLSKLLLDRNATVSICHSRTADIYSYTKSAELLVTAVGNRPNFTLTRDMVTEEVVIIDVGMNYLDQGLCGDVDFANVKEKASFISPVPGGIGPMTRVMLLENVLAASNIRSDG